MTDYWVSNRTDAGGAGTEGDPFRCDEIWDTGGAGAPVGGDTFIFKDGTYAGVNSTVRSAAHGGDGISGSAGSYITLKAENEGQVLLDGGGVLDRHALQISNNDFFKVTGFECTRSTGTAALQLTGCDNVEVRRCIVWDADSVDDNESAHSIQVHNSTDVLVEDCAAFGDTRRCFDYISSGTGTSGGYGNGGVTWRRCWALWTGHVDNFGGPHGCTSHWYLSTNIVFENCIFGVDTQQAAIDQWFGAMTNDNSDHTGAFTYYFGCIAYWLQSNTTDNSDNSLWNMQNMGEYHLKDCVSVIEPGALWTTHKPWTLLNTTMTPPENLTMDDCTGISNGGVTLEGSDWTVTDLDEATSLAGLASTPYDDANGAQVCYQYLNGVRTANPLWPWPMTTRIVNAMVTAGYAPVNVDSQMAKLLGPVPDV